MSAQTLHRVDTCGAYSHIYNRGVEKRVIFNDEEDYKVFLGYLKDYLTPPKDPDSIKKAFKVRGHVFRGTPHQPKNYFNKVELIAYSLMPDRFRLLLRQVTEGSIEGLVRSLCTRYSMYFNKKYKRTGSLFEGPYKSVQISEKPHLLHLTRSLHSAYGYSSYPEYLGSRETSWVRPEVILSSLGEGTGDYSSYKDFVEKYEPDQKEKDLIKDIAFESETQHLEGRDLAARDIENFPPEVPAESSEEAHSDQNLKPLQRIPEILAASVLFLLLFALGMGNITASTIKSPIPSPTPVVLSKTEEIKEVAQKEVPKKIMLTVKITDKSANINIRQKPTINSEKVGKAKDGNTFEFVSVDSEWYEVKLADGSTGFISATYVEMEEAKD